MCLIVKAVFKQKVIKSEAFVVKNTQFQRTTLKGSDKRSWMPRLRVDSLTRQLPGTICQNQKFIQFFSLLLFTELQTHKEVLKSDEWRLYLLLKRFCELINAEQLSAQQVSELDDIYKQYLDLRIRLSLGSKGTDKEVEDNDEDVDNLPDQTPGTLKAWPKVSPKHTFVLCYSQIIKTIGCVGLTHTNRAEAKNGQLKRKARLSNNSKNVPLTMLRSDNEFHAQSKLRGALVDPEVEVKNGGMASGCHDSYFDTWLHHSNYDNYILSDEVTFRQVRYSNDSQVVLLKRPDMKNAFGLVKKIAVERKRLEEKPIVKIVYQETEALYLEDFGLYSLVPARHNFGETLVTELATPFPLYSYKVSCENTEKLIVSLKSTIVPKI